MTTNLSKRISDHKNGSVPGFTKKYNCTKCVYIEFAETIEEAAAREYQLKGWRRSKKNDLISQLNPEWRDLSDQL